MLSLQRYSSPFFKVPYTVVVVLVPEMTTVGRPRGTLAVEPTEMRGAAVSQMPDECSPLPRIVRDNSPPTVHAAGLVMLIGTSAQ